MKKTTIEGQAAKDGFEFDLRKHWEIKGPDFLVARPKISNFRVGTAETAQNDCPVNPQDCSVYFEYPISMAWDVKLKPVSRQVKMSFLLASKENAEPIAPYGKCPESYSRTYQPKGEAFSTFRVTEDEILEILVLPMENGEVKVVQPIPITVEEDYFNKGKIKKFFYIGEELKKRMEEISNNSNKRTGIGERLAKKKVFADWGIPNPDADHEKGPKIVAKRLF